MCGHQMRAPNACPERMPRTLAQSVPRLRARNTHPECGPECVPMSRPLAEKGILSTSRSPPASSWSRPLPRQKRMARPSRRRCRRPSLSKGSTPRGKSTRRPPPSVQQILGCLGGCTAISAWVSEASSRRSSSECAPRAVVRQRGRRGARTEHAIDVGMPRCGQRRRAPGPRRPLRGAQLQLSAWPRPRAPRRPGSGSVIVASHSALSCA